MMEDLLKISRDFTRRYIIMARALSASGVLEPNRRALWRLRTVTGIRVRFGKKLR